MINFPANCPAVVGQNLAVAQYMRKTIERKNNAIAIAKRKNTSLDRRLIIKVPVLKNRKMGIYYV